MEIKGEEETINERRKNVKRMIERTNGTEEIKEWIKTQIR
jgi:hypothetical protein